MVGPCPHEGHRTFGGGIGPGSCGIERGRGRHVEREQSLFVLDTLADWEIAFLTAELVSGRFSDKDNGGISLIRIGNTMEPITTMGGLVITPDQPASAVEFKAGDLLVLPGGDTWLDAGNRKIMDIVSEVIDRDVIIAAICGATLALAGRGLLDHRYHTSNDREFLKIMVQGYQGSDHYRNEPAVTDGNLITATGLAPLEFTREIFKKTGFMRPDTLSAWHELYRTKDGGYFQQLMDSLK